MSNTREFRDIRRRGATAEAKSVDDFMNELGTIQTELATAKNMVWEAVADGSLSEEYLKRLAKEYYFLGRSYTSEFGSLVANAPDADAFSLGRSEHFGHWLRHLADETGYSGSANHVGTVDRVGPPARDQRRGAGRLPAHGRDDRHPSSPRSITCGAPTRRAWPPTAGPASASTPPPATARRCTRGCATTTGSRSRTSGSTTDAEKDHGPQADQLLRQVAVSVDQQRRIRRAVQHTFCVRNLRTIALNRWLDEPGAIRRDRG